MIKWAKRCVSLVQMELNIPEVKLEKNNSLTAFLAPYQTITVNPIYLAFMQHGVKVEKKRLYELSSCLASEAALVGFNIRDGVCAVEADRKWKIFKEFLVLVTSQVQLDQEGEVMLISGQGKAVVRCMTGIRVAGECIYVAKGCVAGYEEGVVIEYGNLEGVGVWKVEGNGVVIIGEGNGSLVSEDGRTFVSYNEKEEKKEGILDNNDIITNVL